MITLGLSQFQLLLRLELVPEFLPIFIIVDYFDAAVKVGAQLRTPGWWLLELMLRERRKPHHTVQFRWFSVWKYF